MQQEIEVAMNAQKHLFQEQIEKLRVGGSNLQVCIYILCV